MKEFQKLSLLVPLLLLGNKSVGKEVGKRIKEEGEEIIRKI